MTIKRRFTKEEDSLILSTVAENPHNLSKCFREIAIKINRGPKSIANRWYHYLSKKDSNDKTNTVFITVGKKKAFLNRKIVPEGMPEESYKVRKSLWEKLKNLFSK